MSTSTQPSYNDIVVSNFAAASHPNILGAYCVVFESYSDNTLRIAEVKEGEPVVPEIIPGCDQFVSEQKIGVTYYGAGSDISLFYLGGQSSGNIYQKKRVSGIWQDETELKVDRNTNLRAGQDAYIGCTTSGTGFNLYYIETETKVTVATSSSSSIYWKTKAVSVDGDDIYGLRGGPVAVATSPFDTLLAYTDKDYKAQIVCRKNGSSDWTQLQGITDIKLKSPLAVNLDSAGKDAGVFNVFYRKKKDSSYSVSVVRRSRDQITEDASAFSTTESASNFAALTVKVAGDCQCSCSGCTGPVKPIGTAQRFLAISKRDNESTLFQYRRTPKKKWIIPQGLIITNSDFNS